MLRTVHVAERETHHFVEDLHGIFRGFRKADTENAVDAFGVALVTDVMTVHAASLAEFFFMADRALHQNIGQVHVVDDVLVGKPALATSIPWR